MDWFNGKKTYIVAALAGIVVVLRQLDIIDEATATTLLGLLGAGGLATLRAGVSKAAPVVLAVLGLGLAITPAHAQDAGPPAFGCGNGQCSIYLIRGGWSPGDQKVVIGGNAIEFLEGGFGVGLPMDAHAEGDAHGLGALCLIPKVRDVPILCSGLSFGG